MQKEIKNLLTIGEIAKRSGIAISAIRFYEEKGLIFSSRNNGHQRRYLRHTLRRIALIKIAQRVGMTLSEIQQAFAQLPQQHAATKSDWQQLSKTWQSQLEEKIHLLKAMQSQLDWCIGCGCLSLEGCPLRNPEDIFAKNPQAVVAWEKQHTAPDKSEM